ncbi:MAG: ABC transporter substrate-binding protein, partial [Gallicola sp.]|nr:ABC transporter substrate-binding protein [Gallicola sp.]
MKKIKYLVLLLAMTIFASSCSSGGADSTGTSNTENKNYKIGISQFAQHGSLDNCREGFIKGLAESGIVEGENLTVDYQNAEAATANANTIAQNFVGNKVDLIAAIATPSAMSAFNAALDTEIPLVYTAITDPVAAQLATEDGKSTGNVTGTSDILPVEEQLKLMREMLPEAKTIGILYTTSEANSVSMIKLYEELAPKYDFTLVTEGVSATADIPLAADSILEKVDALTNLTDNTVVSSLPLILDKANAKNIPVFGSEIEQVKI